MEAPKQRLVQHSENKKPLASDAKEKAVSTSLPLVLQLQKQLGNRVVQRLLKNTVGEMYLQGSANFLKLTSPGHPVEIEAQPVTKLLQNGPIPPLHRSLPPGTIARSWTSPTPVALNPGQMLVSFDLETGLLRVQFQEEAREALPPWDIAIVVEQQLSLSEGALEVDNDEGNVVVFRFTESMTDVDYAHLNTLQQMSGGSPTPEETRMPAAAERPGAEGEAAAPVVGAGPAPMTPAERLAPAQGEAAGQIPEDLQPGVQRFRDALAEVRARSAVFQAARRAAREIQEQEIPEIDACIRYRLTSEQLSVYLAVMNIVNYWEGVGGIGREGVPTETPDPCRGLAHPEDRAASVLNAAGQNFAFPELPGPGYDWVGGASDAAEPALHTLGFPVEGNPLREAVGQVGQVLDVLGAIHDADYASACADDEGRTHVREVSACFTYAEEHSLDPVSIYRTFRVACQRIDEALQCRREQAEGERR